MKEFIRMLKSWDNWSGRACRREYWMSVLILVIFIFAACALDVLANTKFMFVGVLFLFCLIPSYAVSVRRLHDIGKSGYWLFINLVPFGCFWFLYLVLQDSDPGRNRYGINPKEIKSLF